jgi:hypothetical protein
MRENFATLTARVARLQSLAAAATDGPDVELESELRAARLKLKNALIRRARHEAYTACGLTRVRGNLGGTYYE